MVQWKDQFAVEGTSGGYFARLGDMLHCYLEHYEIPWVHRNILWVGAEREMREVLNESSFVWRETQGQEEALPTRERGMTIEDGIRDWLQGRMYDYRFEQVILALATLVDEALWDREAIPWNTIPWRTMRLLESSNTIGIVDGIVELIEHSPIFDCVNKGEAIEALWRVVDRVAYL